MKYIAFSIIIFLFSALNVYSQFLEPKDIDIFINGDRKIDDYIKEEDNMVTESILTTVRLLLIVFSIAISDVHMPEESLIKFIDNFYTFISLQLKDEYNEILIKMGWENNGHQKYWTIFFGVSAIIGYNSNYDSYNGQDHRIFRFFNRGDLELINSRIEDLINIMGGRVTGLFK